MSILQVIRALVWLGVVPMLIGYGVLGLLRRKEPGFCLAFSIGHMTMFAAFLIISFPLIITKQAFHVVYYIMVALYLLFSLASLIFQRNTILQESKNFLFNLHRHAWSFYLAVVAVAVQCYGYIFYKLENADDAYYVATATTTLVYDSMYRISPYNGMARKLFQDRYICSPYPIYQAFLAKCTDLSATVIAHTILPPFLVLVAYAGFVIAGKTLFSENGIAGEKTKKTEEMTGLFIVLLSWIHITSYYCMKNTGSILLIRVWQGKATLGGVILPLIFVLCYRLALYKEEKGNTILLFICAWAAVLTSSMAIALVPVMFGIFALLFGIFKKNMRYFLCMVFATMPCIFMGGCNLLIRFIQR